MKELIAIIVGVLLVVGMIVGGVSYNTYLNRDKPHVFTPEEIFATECAKRGGNPKTEVGSDYTGDKSVEVKEYKCEGVK